MSSLSLPLSKVVSGKHISITGSKSETNRLLLLQAMYPNISLENTSNSDDSDRMRAALKSTDTTIDIHHAGTTMRFLTAYFALCQEKEIILTGSERMQERPIKILVEALRQLGARIDYVKNDGCPPLKIYGTRPTKNKVSIQANVSSQYLSALLLIAPYLENGLEMELVGEITSLPYLKMTLQLLNDLGIKTSFEDSKIVVCPKNQLDIPKTMVVESDWSSASYYYSLIALSEVGTSVSLSSYREDSLQGDSALAEIYMNFGVKTDFQNHQIILTKITNDIPEKFTYDLIECPDIAQTIAVTCVGLGIGCHLTGLHTLKIKETDRLVALQNELKKLGRNLTITDKDLQFEATSENLKSSVAIDTYNDHRMAMAFAPLALRVPIVINDSEVVTKSYPDFWEDLKLILTSK